LHFANRQTNKQTGKQTDKQIDSIEALSRSRLAVNEKS